VGERRGEVCESYREERVEEVRVTVASHVLEYQNVYNIW
jgi:hypothetical protein